MIYLVEMLNFVDSIIFQLQAFLVIIHTPVRFANNAIINTDPISLSAMR